MRLATLLLVAVLCSAASADAPFPNNAKNRWAYASMQAIKKDKLWYRFNEQIPRHPVPTRVDMATKVIYLAVDSKTLIDAFERSARMSSVPASDAESRQWAKKFAASFPAKKVKYQTHLKRVIRLWNYFRPEIRAAGKEMHLDVAAVGKQLMAEPRQLDQVHLANAAL